MRFTNFSLGFASCPKGVLLGWLAPAVEREKPLVKQMLQKGWENCGRYLLGRGQKIAVLNVILIFIPNYSWAFPYIGFV